MSNSEQRWPAADARKVADYLVDALTPCCERICVAGSLRRGKPHVGDIEILYVPRMGKVRKPGELFPVNGSLADELFDRWLTGSRPLLAKRQNVNGAASWGEWNKSAVHLPSRINVDLFATTAA